MTLPPDDRTTPARESPRAVGLAIVLVALLALTMRLVQIHESLWLDELHTAWTVDDNWNRVVVRAKQGSTSPLYFCLPWLTTKLCGMSEGSLRLPSALLGTAAVLLIFGLVRQWTQCPVAALTAATLAAIDPTFLFFAQEARAYASVQAVGLAHVWLFARLLDAPNRSRAVGLVVTAATLFYLHYTTALLFAGEAAAFVVFCLVPTWRPALSWRWCGVIGLAVAALTGPAVPHLLEIAARRGLWKQIVVDASPAAITTEFALGRYFVLPLAATVACFAWRTWRGRAPTTSRITTRHFAFVAIWFIVPVTIAWLATNRDLARIFLPRYVIVVAAAPIVFAALCVAAGATWRSKLTIAVVVIGATSLVTDYPQQLTRDGRLLADRNEDWRGAVQFINRDVAHRSLPVVICSGLIEATGLRGSKDATLRAFCLFPVSSIYRLERSPTELIPLAVSGPLMLADPDRQRIQRQRGVWLIIRGTDQKAIDDRVGDVVGIVNQVTDDPVVERFPFGTLTLIRASPHFAPTP